MAAEDLLRRLQRDLTPRPGAQARIHARLQARMSAPQALQSAHVLLTPSSETKHMIWERISASLLATRAQGLLVELRGWLAIPDELRRTLWLRLSPQLVPGQQSRGMFWGMKWAAAMTLLIFVVQLSPRMFWAPHSAAGSETMLLPYGNVSILIDEVWQPVTEETTLRAGMRIQTGEDGQASIVLGDDGVVRLDHGTMIDLVDLSDRMEPATELVPTLSLFAGRLWMQGLVPANLRGLTVFTPTGLVTVNGGSVSIGGDKVLRVEVYDRSARVTREGNEVSLVAGEQTLLRDSGVPSVRKLSENVYASAWVRGNLSLDAVHRKEIAALQKTRMAERARILPTSTLYPVKRAVEAVDLFLTLGEEAKIQKKLQHADTRLTEAAALLASGQTGAVALPLEEYRSALVALSTGSGDATLAQFFLQQVVTQNASDVAAVLPGDEGYILKQVVLETSSELADGPVAEKDVQGGLLIDALSVLTQTAETGNMRGLQDLWVNLQPQLKVLKSRGTAALVPETRRQALASLEMLALSLKKQEEMGQTQKIDPLIFAEISSYLPAEAEPVLSESDVLAMVAGIKQRIFVYHLTQSRLNQFMQELKDLNGHADQGRILRRLYFALPGGPENFPERVRQEIIRLGWQKASQQ